jgi:hypothetical protein
MTREEAKEKYGSVPCLFSSYYKYTFTFRGKAEDGAEILFSIGGGCADDIYKTNVTRDGIETINGNDWDDDLGFVVKRDVETLRFDPE